MTTKTSDFQFSSMEKSYTFWIISGFKYNVECNTVIALWEVPEFSYFVILLKIEITSFPYMEILSPTRYSNEQTKNSIRSHLVFRCSCSALYLNFSQFILDQNSTMASLDRNLPVKCTKSEKIVVKQQMARHKNSCDSGTLNCPKCPHFYAKRKEDLRYRLAKHHAPQDRKLSTVCTLCLKEFPSCYSLQQHKRRKHGISTKVGTKSSESLK